MLNIGRASRLILFAAGCVIQGACTVAPTAPPIDQSAIGEYRAVVEALRVESSTALTRERDLAYQSFLQRMTQAARADPRPLLMEFPPDSSFAWQVGGSESQSVEFIEIGKVRGILDSLHQLLLDYLDVLSQLNSAAAPAAEKLNASTEKLSGSLVSVSKKLDLEVNEQRMGVFSEAASALGRELLARKQRAGITAVMSDFQPVLVNVARSASAAVATSATGIKSHYQDKANPLARAVITAAPGEREPLVAQLLALNERTIEQLTILQELFNAYQRLPAGHLALMEAMQSGGVARMESLVLGITAIADLNQRLQAAKDTEAAP